MKLVIPNYPDLGDRWYYIQVPERVVHKIRDKVVKKVELLKQGYTVKQLKEMGEDPDEMKQYPDYIWLRGEAEIHVQLARGTDYRHAVAKDSLEFRDLAEEAQRRVL
ncbi:MAG: hypothetical protein ABEK59_07375 [Halobacteria archaeon]